MRILHLDTGRTMRGGQHQVLLLLEGLQNLGHSQTLLAGAPLLERWPGQSIGVTVLRREASSADLIHAHDSAAHTLAVLGCPHKPLVVSRRVAFESKHGIFSRFKYRRAHRFLAVSKYVADRLRAVGVVSSKIEVIYDAVHPPDYHSAGMQHTGLVVGPYSNDPLKKGPLLQAAVRQAGLSLHLSKNLVTDLSSASIFAYLSVCEGLGSAILLAMAHKVPVVASHVGGIPEIVEHERTGLLVTNNSTEIANALKRFAHNPNFAQECTERAYQQFLEHFTDDIMVKRTERAYHKVLGLGTPS